MKKVLKLSIISLISLVILITGASALDNLAFCSTSNITYITGVITDQTNENALVAGADVTISCNDIIKTNISNANGKYSIYYFPSECGSGDEVTVYAIKNGLSGSNKNTISNKTLSAIQCIEYGCCTELKINAALINVPLVPEFGLIAGLATILGAFGIFFVVRKK